METFRNFLTSNEGAIAWIPKLRELNSASILPTATEICAFTTFLSLILPLLVISQCL